MSIARLLAAVSVLGVALAAAAPALAITRAQADAVARSALKPQAAGKYVRVFGLPAALPAGTAISEAGPGPTGQWTVVETAAKPVLRAVVPRTRLAGAGWLFWEDPRSGANFPHASRLLLVDDRTGHVAWEATIDWWPLVNDQPAAFYAHSNQAVYRLPASATAVARADKAYAHDCLIALVDLSDGRPLGNFAGDGHAMVALAERFGMRADLVGTTADLERETDILIREGCKDVVLFIAGHGTPAEGPGATVEPTVITHTHVAESDDGTETTVDDEVVTASFLKNFVERRRDKASFKILINSCFSGRFVDELSPVPGIVFVSTASQADELSWEGLPTDSAPFNPYEAGTWVDGLTDELIKVVAGAEPNVDAADAKAAESDLVFALTLATRLSGLENTGTDRAAALGLTHPSSTGALTADGISYRYLVKIDGSATASNFVDAYGVPGTHPTFKGSAQSSFSFTVPYAFVLNPKAGTVSAAEQALTFPNGSGVDSFSLTGADPPRQPPDTCAIPPNTNFKAVGSLAPIWGGLPDIKSFRAGVMLFTFSVEPEKSNIYACSLSTPASRQTITVQSGYSIPGARLVYVDIPPSKNPDPSLANPGCVSGALNDIYIPIPLSDLGQGTVTTTFDPVVACQSTFLDATYTAHAHYTITLTLEGMG